MPSIEQAQEQLRSLLCEARRPTSVSSPDFHRLTFPDENGQTLVFEHLPADQLTLCAERYFAALLNSGNFSLIHVNYLIRTALVDLHRSTPDGSQVDPDAVRRVTAKLSRIFKSAPSTFRVIARVVGLNGAGLPAEFGNVTLRLFTDEILQECVEHLTQACAPEHKQELVQECTNSFKRLFAVDTNELAIVATIASKASDFICGVERAIAECRHICWALNLLSDSVGVHSEVARVAVVEMAPFASYFGDSNAMWTCSYWREQPANTEMFIAESDEHQRGFGTFYRPSFLRRLPPRTSDLPSAKALRVFSQWLKDSVDGRSNEVRQRILTAIRWAGRAASTNSLDDAILFYMTSLETALLSPKDDSDKGPKVALRFAQLYGGDVATRRDVHKRMKGLFATRNRIAHTGRMDVQFEERSLAAEFCRDLMMDLLIFDPFRDLTTHQEVEDWFTDQSLDTSM